MNVKECQNCAMKMTKPEDFGTEKNGETSEDYCCNCETLCRRNYL